MVASLKQNDKTSSELEELMNRKIQLEQELASIEKQIYNLETSYLESTSNRCAYIVTVFVLFSFRFIVISFHHC
jgi:hypothetical protein